MKRATMKRFAPTLPILACFLALLPGVASAALSIGIGLDVSYNPPLYEGYFDLVFHETGTPTNEGLFAYDLYIRTDSPSISLVRAEKPDNWVFTAPNATFQQADVPVSNPPGMIVVNAIGDVLGANQDIVDGTKAARVYFTLDPNLPIGVYHVFLDPREGTTMFVSGDTGEVIPVDLSDAGTVTWTPEPAAASLLALAAPLLLRRLRRLR